MNYNCDYYMELISAAIDGELTADEERVLNEHLESCEKCRKIKEEYEFISSVTAENAVMVEPPETLLEGVMGHVRQSGKYKKRHYGRYLGLAASLAVVIMGTFMFNSTNAKTTRLAAAPAAAVMEAPAEAESPSLAFAAESAAVSEEAAMALDYPVFYIDDMSREDILALFQNESENADVLFDYSAELVTSDEESIYVYAAGNEMYCYSDEGTLMTLNMSWSEFAEFVHINK